MEGFPGIAPRCGFNVRDVGRVVDAGGLLLFPGHVVGPMDHVSYPAFE